MSCQGWLGNAFSFKEDKQAGFVVFIEVLDSRQTAQFSKNKDLLADFLGFFNLEMQPNTFLIKKMFFIILSIALMDLLYMPEAG